jgi:hypothetical protein
VAKQYMIFGYSARDFNDGRGYERLDLALS